MSTEYALKYASQVDERFKLGSITNGAVNNDYQFNGVKTVKVYTVPTAAMGNYTRSGSSRYGTPTDLELTAQTLTLTRDRAFTFVIDKGDYNETEMVAAAGQALQRQIDEVIIPEVDVWRISKMASGAGTDAHKVLTKADAYDAFLDGITALTDAKVPLTNRIAYVSPAFYKLIKEDSTFIKASDLAQNMLIKGQIGEIDGVRIMLAPTSYLPTNCAFIITNPMATVAPIKLNEYKIHQDPPGINGWLVEGRVNYDAFVLDNKKNAIYVHYNSAS